MFFINLFLRGIDVEISKKACHNLAVLSHVPIFTFFLLFAYFAMENHQRLYNRSSIFAVLGHQHLN